MHDILNSYIKKVIVSNIAIVFLVLVSLSSIIKLIDELRKIEEDSFCIMRILVYVIFSLPKDFELFFPIATLLGGLLGLSVFEVHNEFIAMQVFGISKSQIALSVVKAAIPILLCSVISSEWVIPNSEKIIYSYRNQLQNDVHVFSVKIKDCWFIDNNDFVHVENVVTYEELLGICIYVFNKEKRLNKIYYVERAIFLDGFWNLINVNELDVSEELFIASKKISHIKWNFSITPYKLSIITAYPNVLSISKLYRCITYFNKIGQNSKCYQIIFWNKILSPISNLVMIILALSCTFGPLYKQKISIRLFIGSIVGFIFYILNQIFSTLIIVYNYNPIFGAMLPSITLLIISAIITYRYYYV